MVAATTSERAPRRLFAALTLAAALGGCARAASPAAVPPPVPEGDPPAAAVPAGPPGADPCRLPPEERMVRLDRVEPGIRQDIRYATADNFTGARLPGYDAPLAVLRPHAAEALARVHRRLERDGLGLKVFDAYRPIRATLAMVDWARRTDNEWVLREGYVARMSGHNRGATVDLTLVRLRDGQELEMGTAYDTFSEAAHTANATGQVRENRMKLVRAMQAEGFRNYAKEWWHFSAPGSYPPLDVPLRCFR